MWIDLDPRGSSTKRNDVAPVLDFHRIIIAPSQYPLIAFSNKVNESTGLAIERCIRPTLRFHRALGPLAALDAAADCTKLQSVCGH